MKQYKLIEGNKFSKIDVSYSLGGINYMTGDHNRRGIYIHFTIVERTERDGYTTESYGLFADGSFKILFEELKRKSQKKMDAAIDWVMQHKERLHDLHTAGNKSELLRLIQGGAA